MESGAGTIRARGHHADAGCFTSRQLKGVWYIDHASGSNRVDKFQRDARLLREALKTDPNNHRYWFYLAQSYRDGGQTGKAVHVRRMTW